jgi:hypothetical protein
VLLASGSGVCNQRLNTDVIRQSERVIYASYPLDRAGGHCHAVSPQVWRKSATAGTGFRSGSLLCIANVAENEKELRMASKA